MDIRTPPARHPPARSASCPRTSACSRPCPGVEFVAYAGELCGMAPADAMQRAHEVLNYVGLDEARYRPVESYSTGMKQRLKLAAAIVHDPKLLILDEPTNGMDPAGRQEMIELARDLSHNKGMSLIFSSHLLPDVEAVCDHVLVLGRGELLAQGNIQEMKQAHPRCVRGAAQGRRRRRSSRRLRTPAATPSRATTCCWCSCRTGRRRTCSGGSRRDAGEQIRYLRPQRSSLEDVFLEGRRGRTRSRCRSSTKAISTGRASCPATRWRWLAVDPARRPRPARRTASSASLLLVAWLPALALVAAPGRCGACSSSRPSRSSTFLQPLLPPEVIAEPQDYRSAVWTIAYSFFFKAELVCSLFLVAGRRPEPHQPRPALQRPAAVLLAAAAADRLLPRQARRHRLLPGGHGGRARRSAAYLLGVAFSLDLGVVRDTHRLLWAGVLLRAGHHRCRPARSCWRCRRCRGGRSTSAWPGRGSCFLTHDAQRAS